MNLPERIDIHAHFLPPFYRQACLENGHGMPDGMPAIPEWSESAHLELMKEVSITKSILSISSPGVHLFPGDDLSARQLARQCNDFAADLCRRYSERFGFWAALPLPDVEGTFEEIRYALDELHADGVAMESNHHGIYLGDSAFDGVFDELNRKKATVFIHPTSPFVRNGHGWGCTSATVLSQFPNPMFEFMFDTARAIINLFLSGTIARCPNITFVVPHAGSVLPPIVQRFCSFATSILSLETEMTSGTVKETFKRQFYFDLAGFPFPDQIWGILRLVGPERLLYGSDFPFTPERGVMGLADVMRRGLEEMFDDKVIRDGIYVANARRLLAR